MNSYDDLFQNKAFQCLDKEKLEVIKLIAQKANGKSAMEIMQLFNQYSPALTKGKPLTDQEKAAMIEVLKLNMNPSERKQLENVMNMMRMMGKGI